MTGVCRVSSDALKPVRPRRVRRVRRGPAARGGFMVAEIIMGLAFLIVLAGVLMVTMVKLRQAEDRMANQRAAARAAEAAAVALASGGTVERGVTVRRVDGGAPAGRAWVDVSATREGRTVSVTALVPEGAIKSAASAPAGAGRGT